MTLQSKILIANRGEIALRIARTAWDMGLTTVAVYAADEHPPAHSTFAAETHQLSKSGPAAYLDQVEMIRIAKQSGCQYIHPGYGFLSENAEFARACHAQDLIFIGPSAETLALFGDKSAARAIAAETGVPILPGTEKATTLAEAERFLAAIDSPLVIKAVAGGGGRGMRVVDHVDQLTEAWERCRSEAQRAFGEADLYIEQWLSVARHIEVQIAGDGQGWVRDFDLRECSIQRQRQKLIEIAPVPEISSGLKKRLVDAAVNLAKRVNFRSLGTVEFLVSGLDLSKNASFYFLELNPRIQVEHTVTEEVFGIDLVALQLEVALDRKISIKENEHLYRQPQGMALQLRVNLEQIDTKGMAQSSAGQITDMSLPSGPGIRIDKAGEIGFTANPRYDSLFAKLVLHRPTSDFSTLKRAAIRSLRETYIAGAQNNVPLLHAILEHPQFKAANLYTDFFKDHLSDLLKEEAAFNKFQPAQKGTAKGVEMPPQNIIEGYVAVRAPMPGSIISILVESGERVNPGQPLGILEAMKMESVISVDQAGIVHQIMVQPNDIVNKNELLFILDPMEMEHGWDSSKQKVDLDHIRPDLAEVYERRGYLWDENRPAAVAKRHKKGQRTARENIADLCDPESFIEYGSAIVAAQRTRRSLEDLIERTPADGLITGYGTVNGDLFSAELATCMIMAYDYTVLAGTQGALNHKKMDRMLKLAANGDRPLILFAEGGGGRPGDVDYLGVASLDVMTFTLYAQLSGQIPLVTIVSGYCFAGNAALAGCADVIIATENSSLGMGGPAMIEGGGLGNFHPREVGPMSFQASNGVVDLLVADEKEAVAAAKKYVAYFQGPVKNWSCADQRELRHLIPENRKRIYDMKLVIATLADSDSVLELRADFGIGLITALARIEGKAIGIIANNPTHLGGAIDADGADKAARFMQLCDAHRLPLLSLVDTPGIMVGPEAEKSGTVRHASRLFITGASLSVPFMSIVIRKGYGLGAQVMCGGSFHVPIFTVGWPTAEFGAMGLEGAVKLGFRKELEAVTDPEEQKNLFDKMVAQAYEHGKAINTASYLEIDEVIDPIESRQRITAGLTATAGLLGSRKSQRPMIDSW